MSSAPRAPITTNACRHTRAERFRNPFAASVSGVLQEASPADIDTVTRVLGIRTVIDLRRPDETKRDDAGRGGSTALANVKLPMVGPDRSAHRHGNGSELS